MYYIVYKTTNLINEKIYVGTHQTKNKDDDYLGSGKRLAVAIKKYGRDNFKKEILFLAESIEDMFLKEKEIVTKEFCKRDDVYNIKPGGWGGFQNINDGSEKHIERCTQAGKISYERNLKGNTKGIFKKGDLRTLEMSKKANQNRILNGLSDDHKMKISISMRRRNSLKRQQKDVNMSLLVDETNYI